MGSLLVQPSFNPLGLAQRVEAGVVRRAGWRKGLVKKAEYSPSGGEYPDESRWNSYLDIPVL
jgi:hypothetical protein